MPEINVRNAEYCDLSQIAELKWALDAEDEILIDRGQLHSTLRQHLFGAQPTFEGIVADHSSEVVGVLLFCLRYYTSLTHPAIYVQDLFVQAEHRRMGIGSMLLKAVAGRALALGSPHVELHVKRTNPARQFYEANGFHPVLDALVYTGSRHVISLLIAPRSSA